MPRHYIAVLVVALVAFGVNRSASACPFCSAVSQTFGEEMNAMDVVVIASLVKPTKSSSTSDEEGEEISKAKFKIETVIKGDSHLNNQREIETLFFGEAKIGQRFLVMGVDPPKLMWSTPLRLSERAEKYIDNILELPEKGPERLTFFQDYLEDEDEVLARDAYDEFAKAPYSEVKGLKMDMNHERVIGWIQDTDVPASRRRLYLVMLGVCGSEKDLPMLEELMGSSDRKKKAGLDAMISCYLTLKGPTGMSMIEDLFLKNKNAEYADTYAAIMALRFHGKEDDIIPRDRILHGLRFMLERPQLADLVIPDLAKWEDWSVMEKLVKLFKDADEKSSWVRVPVVNYLRACPLPESDDYIKELKKVDPAAVKRAETFFPIGPKADGEKSTKVPAQKTGQTVPFEEGALTAALVPPPRDEDKVADSKAPAVASRSGKLSRADVTEPTLNPFAMLGVTLVAATAIMLLQWSILVGRGRASA